MSNEREIDEILASFQKRRSDFESKIQTDSEEFTLQIKSLSNKTDSPKPDDKKELGESKKLDFQPKKEEKQADDSKNACEAPKPPVVKKTVEKKEEPAPPKKVEKKEANDANDALNLIWLSPEELLKKQNQASDDIEKTQKSKSKFSFKKLNIKDNFNQQLLPKLKALGKKIFTKVTLIVLAVAVAIAGIAFGGVKLYEYSKVAYLKPYQEKYNITFPEGILEQMCDAYGKNQSLYGKITISDTSTDEFVYTDQIDNLPYMSNGADVNENQHIVCVNLDKSYCDLESVYSTTDGYLQSSQIVEFSTLFESSKYMVYASYYTNTNPEDDSDYVFPYNVCGTLTDDSFDDFIDRIDHRSLYDINYTPSNKNYFLTLSVDSDFMENSKFVVLCIKLDDSENFSKITSATDNPSVHYQQKWYDQQNLQNPYRFSSKWYPEIYLPDSVKTTQLSQEDFT